MTRILYLRDRLLASLRYSDDEIVFGLMSRAKALETLKEMTGQDFGYDIKAWSMWLHHNPTPGLEQSSVYEEDKYKSEKPNIFIRILRVVKKKLGFHVPESTSQTLSREEMLEELDRISKARIYYEKRRKVFSEKDSVVPEKYTREYRLKRHRDQTNSES